MVGAPRSVARRIVTLALSLYLATAAVATLAEVGFLAVQLRADAQKQAASLAQTFGPPVALALWDYDEGQLEILLSTLSANPALGRVRVVEAGSPVLERFSGGPLGSPQSFALTHQQGGKVLVLGELILEPSLKLADRLLATQVLLAAGRTAFLVLLLSVILVLVVRQRVTGPLTRLADEVSALDPEGSAAGVLDPDPRGGAELHRVGDAFQRLLEGYRGTIVRLDRQQAQLRTLLDTLPDLVWLKDGQGVYLACNRRFEAFFGVPEAEILGKTDFDFVDPAAAEVFREFDRQALEAGGPHRNEEEIVFASDGHREYLETIKTPVLDAEGRVLGVLGIGRDITDRRRAALEMERLVQELRQSHKLESLGHLAGGLAHEMNNVLAVVLGLTTVQLAQAPPESRLQADLDTIRRAADRGAGLVKSLLSFARRSPAELQTFRLNDLLRREQALVDRVTASRARVVLDLDESLSPVAGDPDALLSAVLNLCGNAADAMPDGGTLTLRTRQRPEEVQLEVEDTGTGMSAEVLAQALDPFFTTKPVGRGTGLGLSFVDSTVRAHGGRVELNSVLDRGTVVRITLPAAGLPAGPPPVPDPAAPPPPVIRGLPLQLLVIDDDELVRESTTEIAASLGHRVEAAPSGEDGLALLAGGLRPDLIVLDKNMPGLGGRGTLERLRTLLPGVPVLLATGLVDQEALDLVQGDPRVTLIGKPFSVAELAAKIAAAASSC